MVEGEKKPGFGMGEEKGVSVSLSLGLGLGCVGGREGRGLQRKNWDGLCS